MEMTAALESKWGQRALFTVLDSHNDSSCIAIQSTQADLTMKVSSDYKMKTDCYSTKGKV